jgi:CheY-like chemotaxis protein
MAFPKHRKAFQMKGPVLLVEDDPENAAGYVAVLEAAGYRVEHVGNGAEALAVLRRGLRPVAILLDLMMPVMDGVAFRRVQQSIPAFRDIPVVALSGVDHLFEEIRGHGVTAVLKKPVVFLKLLKTLEAHADRSRVVS